MALTGQLAPGVDGSRFAKLDVPFLNDAGQIVFGGTIEGAPGLTRENDGAFWAGDVGQLRLVVREGDPAPGTPAGVRFGRLQTPTINGTGRVVFQATLSGEGVVDANEAGIWSDVDGPLSLVAREGDVAPESAGKVFTGFFSLPSVNDAGQVAFAAELAPSVVSGESGSWVARMSVLNLVARRGVQAPGFPQGVNFSVTSGPTLDQDGELVFTAIAQSGLGDVTRTNNDGVWVDRDGVQRLIARQGTPALGVSPKREFGYFGSAINNGGQIAFISGLQDNSGQVTGEMGVWIERQGILELVARSLDPAPGTTNGTVLSGLGDLRLNRLGETAFWARLQGESVTSENDSAILAEDRRVLEIVAREGDQAPGVSAGTTFGSFTGTRTVFNDRGQVAFPAKLVGEDVHAPSNQGVPTNIVNDRGIWGQDRGGNLRLVIRAGDIIDVDDGPAIDLRQISGLRFTGLDGGGRNYQGFNDLGQLVFGATFTDGSSGIFLSEALAVPEPNTSTLVMLAASAVALIHRIRHTAFR